MKNIKVVLLLTTLSLGVSAQAKAAPQSINMRCFGHTLSAKGKDAAPAVSFLVNAKRDVYKTVEQTVGGIPFSIQFMFTADDAPGVDVVVINTTATLKDKSQIEATSLNDSFMRVRQQDKSSVFVLCLEEKGE